VSAGRQARRQLDRQLRREGKPRALFRIHMKKNGSIAESVRIEHRDATAMIRSIELVLAGLKAQLASADNQLAAPDSNNQAPQHVPSAVAAPQSAAAQYFGKKEPADE